MCAASVIEPLAMTTNSVGSGQQVAQKEQYQAIDCHHGEHIL